MVQPNSTINDTSAAILGLLHQEKMIGHHICEMAEKWIDPYFSITRSQVYRDLIAMQKLGLVREAGSGPRNATLYQITPAGRRAFQAWMTDSVGLDNVRNAMALRVAFAGLLPNSKSISNTIDALLNEHTQAIMRIESTIIDARNSGLTGDVEALQFILGYHKMTRTWLMNVKV